MIGNGWFYKIAGKYVKRLGILLLGLLFCTACSGLDYVRISPGAEKFHPKTIVVLPISAGKYELSRTVVETFVISRLESLHGYNKVITPEIVKSRLYVFPGFSQDVDDYIVRLNTLEASDNKLARHIGAVAQADAILHVKIINWDYDWAAGEKVARVGLTLTLVDSANGDIIWRATHKLVENYDLVRPPLENVGYDLVELMIEKMPH